MFVGIAGSIGIVMVIIPESFLIAIFGDAATGDVILAVIGAIALVISFIKILVGKVW